jgi:hypothetical protein
MKYSIYFKIMITLSLFFLGLSIEAYLENMPTLCAVLSVITFLLGYAGIMAPNSEKYKQ